MNEEYNSAQVDEILQELGQAPAQSAGAREVDAILQSLGITAAPSAEPPRAPQLNTRRYQPAPLEIPVPEAGGEEIDRQTVRQGKELLHWLSGAKESPAAPAEKAAGPAAPAKAEAPVQEKPAQPAPAQPAAPVQRRPIALEDTQEFAVHLDWDGEIAPPKPAKPAQPQQSARVDERFRDFFTQSADYGDAPAPEHRPERKKKEKKRSLRERLQSMREQEEQAFEREEQAAQEEAIGVIPVGEQPAAEPLPGPAAGQTEAVPQPEPEAAAGPEADPRPEPDEPAGPADEEACGPQPEERPLPDEPTGEFAVRLDIPAEQPAPAPQEGAAEQAAGEETTGEESEQPEEPTRVAEGLPEESGDEADGAGPDAEETEETGEERPRPLLLQKEWWKALLGFGEKEEAEEPFLPLEGDEAEEEADRLDYNTPEDAAEVRHSLSAMSARFGLRAILTGLVGLVLLWLGVAAAAGGGKLPGALDPVGEPAALLTVNLVLMAVAALLSLGVLKSGLAGLFGAASADTMPALAALGALLQSGVLLAGAKDFDPGSVSLFSGVAALCLCANAVGKLVHTRVVARNFEQTSARVEHWAAATVQDKERAATVAAGLEEPEPRLLVSRPTALVKGFLRRSFSPRASERTARRMARLLLGAAVLCGLLAAVLGGGVSGGVNALAAALCLGAPFASTLLAAVPSLLLQKNAGRVGAVVPGWSAIEELGRTNLIQVGAKDLFPTGSVVLRGIKTFEKERIDLAILYTASVLIEGCDTLRDVFSEIIQGKTDILYPVESFTREVGYGYSAWIDQERVLVGNRDMMIRHGLLVPSLDWEARCSKNGERKLVYLAVSGKMYGVFGVGYEPDEEVRQVLHRLHKRGISVLVKSDDCSLTAEDICTLYGLPAGAVKILNEAERTALSPELIFRPDSEGAMTHLGSFTSFVGGLQAAEGAAEGEKLAAAVQLAAVAFSCAVALLLTFTGGLAGLALPAVVLYQCAWSVLQLAMPLSKRYG